MRAVDIIEKKKNGGELSNEEISSFFGGYMAGSVTDYQVSAFLMAVCLRGMSYKETVHLTRFMAESGDILDLSEFGKKCADKHSTGGVGDKTTLVIAPLAAACGVTMPKMSGRGLGFTGGTIDKLESIDGFTCTLTEERFREILHNIGAAVVSQTKNLAPLDKKLYALRDVTATTESIPLIASSIMSKKIAAGAPCILLDVKCGSGAFMKTREDAEELARTMVAIGNSCGRKTAALITDMSAPLGSCAGNLLEVQEAVEILQGRGEGRLKELCLVLASHILSMTLDIGLEQSRSMAEKQLQNGMAYRKFSEMVQAQGGRLESIFDKKAQYEYIITSGADGYISEIDAHDIGMASGILGAGRERKEDSIDPLAGIRFCVSLGEQVKRGSALAVLYASDSNLFSQARELANHAFCITSTQPEPNPVVFETIY